MSLILPPVQLRHDARCYFNVRSKADTSQLNLPQEPTTKKWKTEKLKSKKQTCTEVSVNSPGMRGVSPEKEKEGCGGKDLQKREV